MPQGAEYRAVQKGCQRVQAAVTIVPLPMGSAAGPSLEPWLKKYKLFANAGYLLVGLGGGLSPDLAPGDRVLCETTQAAAGEGDPIPFDGLLNEWIRQRLPGLKNGMGGGMRSHHHHRQRKTNPPPNPWRYSGRNGKSLYAASAAAPGQKTGHGAGN